MLVGDTFRFVQFCFLLFFLSLLLWHGIFSSIEHKVFELLAWVGVSVVRITKRSKGVSCSISLGGRSVGWLWNIVEGLKQAEGLKEYMILRAGNRVFIAQRVPISMVDCVSGRIWWRHTKWIYCDSRRW